MDEPLDRLPVPDSPETVAIRFNTCVLMTLANEQPTIDGEIDDDDHAGKHKLDFSGKPGRVDDCEKIVLNEALRVARLARLDAKVVLQVCKRADAAGEFNEETPCGDRKMNDGYPAPACREYGAHKGAQDERQVDRYNCVSGQPEKHVRYVGAAALDVTGSISMIAIDSANLNPHQEAMAAPDIR
jgi:hypothetical protein